MNKENNNSEIPAKAIELLPWYCLGLLEPEDKDYIDQMLLEFPELDKHLKIEHEMANVLKEEQEFISLSAIEDREIRLERLLTRNEFKHNKIEEQEPIASKFINIFANIFSGQMSKVQYVGFAAVATLSVALLFAFTMPLLERKSTFYPAAVASGDEKQNINTVLIGLNVAPDDPRLLKILKKHNVVATAISGKDGMYRLKFSKSPSKSDLDKLLSLLSKQTELVWFVGEAY